MQRMLLGLSFGFVALIAATQAAQSQSQPCAPRDRVLEQLGSVYGETRRGAGLAGAQAMVELFASDATGTWTVTVTLPDGNTCLVASGTDWQAMDEPLPSGLRL